MSLDELVTRSKTRSELGTYPIVLCISMVFFMERGKISHLENVDFFSVNFTVNMEGNNSSQFKNSPFLFSKFSTCSSSCSSIVVAITTSSQHDLGAVILLFWQVLWLNFSGTILKLASLVSVSWQSTYFTNLHIIL